MINNYKFRQILQIIYAKIKTLKGGIVMGYLSEYLQKINTHQWGIIQLKEELKKLVKEYNKVKETQLLVYTAAIGKNIPGVAIEQNDFYFINDILKDYRGNKLVLINKSATNMDERADLCVHMNIGQVFERIMK